MIAKLKQFLKEFQDIPDPQQQAHSINLAAACMLLEVVYADEKLDGAEARLLPEVLEQNLGISATDCSTLLEEAKRNRNNATSLFQFTSIINENFSLEQKQQLVLSMWQLAYADGELCRYEDQIIRRSADLLYLKHSELIQLRNRAIENPGH
ncbi:TerB family tellurite resistance protein [Shewanella yunxiaonensis]|uniref:TerB family tellurite resistance protein n=1 Tax=Shewanella yunxiaonensis TaxID=2829809 RepID=A0ABX7YTU5_9GAMM|nr:MULTISPECIES: TerB family tellurite resistance protein [Shewanella]MDF0533373.1 TerB family tellurite resistance protein [Shewanella sp. A32]QUN05761.1 TerB family tellurite resistance protein [Shewanella yunxiaonensis]